MAEGPQSTFDNGTPKVEGALIFPQGRAQQQPAPVVDTVVSDATFVKFNPQFGAMLIANREVRLDRQLSADARTAAFERVIEEIGQADITGTGVTAETFAKKVDAYEKEIFAQKVKSGEKDVMRNTLMLKSNISPQTAYENQQQLSSVFVNRLKKIDGEIAVQNAVNEKFEPARLETAYRARIVKQMVKAGEAPDAIDKAYETLEEAQKADRAALLTALTGATEQAKEAGKDLQLTPTPAAKEEEWITIPVKPRAKDNTPAPEPTPYQEGNGPLLVPPAPAPELKGPKLPSPPSLLDLPPLPPLPGVPENEHPKGTEKPAAGEAVPTPADNSFSAMNIPEGQNVVLSAPKFPMTGNMAAAVKGWSVGGSAKV